MGKEEVALLAVIFVLAQMVGQAVIALLTGMMPKRSILTDAQDQKLSHLYSLHSATNEKTGLPRWWFPEDVVERQIKILGMLSSMQHDNQVEAMKLESIRRVLEEMKRETAAHNKSFTEAEGGITRSLDKLVERSNHT